MFLESEIHESKISVYLKARITMGSNKGEIYTKKWVVELVLDIVGYKEW